MPYTLEPVLYEAYQNAKDHGYVVCTSDIYPRLEHVYGEFCQLQQRPFVYVIFYTGQEINEVPTDPDIAKVGYDCITNHCWPTAITLRGIGDLCRRARMAEDASTHTAVSWGQVRVPEYTADHLAREIYTLLTAPGACRYPKHPANLADIPRALVQADRADLVE